ncbi:hypothetical protein KCU78_g15311, partial [Aureobasidium melanogenum]
MGHRHSQPVALSSNARDADNARRNAMLRRLGRQQKAEMVSLDGRNINRLTSSSEYHLAPERPVGVDQPTSSTADHKAPNLAHENLQRLLLEEDELLAAQIAGDYDMALHLQEEEDRRQVAESQALTRDCAVCCESLHALEFPVSPPSSRCTHLAEVCSSCLQQWVATKIDSNARTTIDCPQCTTILSHEDVRRACDPDPETFARYDRFATLAIIDDLRDFHWCLRVGCTGGQEQVGGILGYMKCHSCNYEQCLQHKTEWHHGESCRQYDARLRDQDGKQNHEQEERETARLMAQQQASTVWKKCPKCQVLIEKTDGCDQMKCRASTMM